MTGYATDEAWGRCTRRHRNAEELAEGGDAGLRNMEAAMRYVTMAAAQGPLSRSPASVIAPVIAAVEGAGHVLVAGAASGARQAVSAPAKLRVVLGTDGSAAADTACELAAGLDWPPGTTIELVSAYDAKTPVTVFPGLSAFPDTIEAIAEAARKEAGTIVEWAARRLERPGLCVETWTAEGRAPEVILDAATSLGANLIVVGHRGSGPFESTIMGSVCAEITERASCPVLVARTGGLGRILVGDDGSGTVARRQELVRALSALYRGPVVVVSVAERDPHWPAWSRALESRHLDRAEELATADRAAHEKVARASAEQLRAAGLDAIYEVIEGQPARCLVDAAVSEQADLIVVGRHAPSGARPQLSGTVARSVLSHAPCSVLVIPDSEPDTDGPSQHR